LARWREAFEARTLELNYRSKLFINNERAITSELRTRFEVAETNNALRLSQLEAENNRVQTWVWGIGAGLVSILTVVLFSAYHAQRRNNRQLAKQNAIIAEQSVQNRLLVREVHHRVKNNLQTLKSMMRLQLRSVMEPSAQQALQSTIHRLDAVAAVHTELYREDRPQAVDLQRHLQTIAQQVQEGQTRSLAELHIRVGPGLENVSVELALPMGLIFNEALLNSFKHAQRAGIDLRVELLVELRAGNMLHTLYRDNGPGFPDGFEPRQARSFGVRMVAALVAQQRGQLRFRNDGGATVEFEFNASSYLSRR
jgi:two-component sensor histidine kinase